MRKGIAYFALLCFSLSSPLWAQDFQNLNFEQIDPSVIPSDQFHDNLPIEDAMPGWTGYLGTNQLTAVLYNNTTLGAASISLYGPNSFPSAILEGQFTAGLVRGGDGAGNFMNVSLAQTGLIPFGAHSVLLRAAGTNFAVSFSPQTIPSAQAIPLVAISNGPNYTVYAGDIFAFAGQVGELRISTVSILGAGVLFDAIAFSFEAIPEPSSLNLVAIGIVGLAFFRRASRKTP